jgi:TPR repeat protein
VLRRFLLEFAPVPRLCCASAAPGLFAASLFPRGSIGAAGMLHGHFRPIRASSPAEMTPRQRSTLLSCPTFLLCLGIAACEFTVDHGPRDTLQSSLQLSERAVAAMPPSGNAVPAEKAEAKSDPATSLILKALTANDVDEAERLLGGLQNGYENGELSHAQLWKRFGLFDFVIPGTLPTLDAWVARYPQSYVARLVRGRQYAALGWDARGGNYASETPSENFREMARLHTLAADDLLASLALARRPFLSVETLMDVARLAGAHETVEKLFEDGVQAMPRTFALYRARMYSAQPRWGGSLQEMRALLARAESDGLAAPEIAWLRAWIMLEENDAEIRSNPRAAVAFAQKAAEIDDRAARWVHRSRVERQHGFLDDALASATRAIALDRDAYEGWAERGLVHEKRGEITDARSDYERGARLGSYDAQERVILARAYGQLGLQRDYAVAREWCELAAAMSNPAGDFCIGGLYFDGLGGLPRDQAEAFKWFRRAAEKGHATAQHDVGWMLVQGKGVARNPDEGIEWLRKAARQNHGYAKAKLRALGVPIEPFPSPQMILKKIIASYIR